jgi:predicted aspartyl protease
MAGGFAQRCDTGRGNDFAVPVLINGRRATYLLDTGAWMSVMTEAEAKRLGLTILEGDWGTRRIVRQGRQDSHRCRENTLPGLDEFS